MGRQPLRHAAWLALPASGRTIPPAHRLQLRSLRRNGAHGPKVSAGYCHALLRRLWPRGLRRPQILPCLLAQRQHRSAQPRLHPMGLQSFLPRPNPLQSCHSHGQATDSVAPPATAAGAAAFAPANPGAVPVHGAPGSPAYIYNAAGPPALNVAPSFSEPSGLFSFPSVPGVQAVPGTPAVAAPLPEPVPLPASAPAAPDSMPDPLALTQLADQFFAALPGNAAPPASLPQLPPVSELFSFPGVPGVPSVPGLPPPPGITLVPDTANAPALPCCLRRHHDPCSRIWRETTFCSGNVTCGARLPTRVTVPPLQTQSIALVTVSSRPTASRTELGPWRPP